jgi:putative tryptophan/tyrosine transport system substrate-binding protein
MQRRQFVTLLGGTAAWPLTARAQQIERIRRIGVLMGPDENDPVGKTYVSAFTQALADLGWIDGRNVRMDVRWAGGDINRSRVLAQELVGLQPDIIVATATPPIVALQRETQTIPIVFTSMTDPVASGIVARLDHPSGNITGFANWEASMGGKWLGLLSEIAPGLKRAAIMFNPDTAPITAYMALLETAARSLKVEPITAPVHSDVEIETAIIALDARELGGEVGASERHLEKEPQGRRRAVHRRRVNAALGLMNLIAAQVLGGRSIRRAAQKLGKGLDAADIIVSRLRTELADVHVLDHATTQRADGFY